MLQDFTQNKLIEKFNNEYTISIVVQLLANMHKLEEAEEFASKMEYPSLIVNTCLVSVYFRRKEYSKIHKIYQNARLGPKDQVFYTTLIHGYARLPSYVSLAGEILLESLVDKIFLRTEVYTKVIQELLVQGNQRLNILFKIHQELLKTNLQISYQLMQDLRCFLNIQKSAANDKSLEIDDKSTETDRSRSQ